MKTNKELLKEIDSKIDFDKINATENILVKEIIEDNFDIPVYKYNQGDRLFQFNIRKDEIDGRFYIVEGEK